MIRYLILISLFVISCSQKIKGNKTEVENIDFKKSFFKCIDNAESYTLNKKNQDSVYVDEDLFMQSLAFLSKYSEVDYSHILGYEIGYFNYEMFKKDKEKWLKWYEENKFKNLKWEDNIPVDQ